MALSEYFQGTWIELNLESGSGTRFEIDRESSESRQDEKIENSYQRTYELKMRRVRLNQLGSTDYSEAKQTMHLKQPEPLL